MLKDADRGRCRGAAWSWAERDIWKDGARPRPIFQASDVNYGPRLLILVAGRGGDRPPQPNPLRCQETDFQLSATMGCSRGLGQTKERTPPATGQGPLHLDMSKVVIIPCNSKTLDETCLGRLIQNLNIQHRESRLSEVATFARHTAASRRLLCSVDCLLELCSSFQRRRIPSRPPKQGWTTGRGELRFRVLGNPFC